MKKIVPWLRFNSDNYKLHCFGLLVLFGFLFIIKFILKNLFTVNTMGINKQYQW